METFSSSNQQVPTQHSSSSTTARHVYYVPTYTVTSDYEKLTISEAIQKYLVQKTQMFLPINVLLPNSKLYITVKTIYELITLDILLLEHDSKSFVKPMKFNFFNLKNDSKLYVPDFMIMKYIPATQKTIYFIIEVPNLRILNPNLEYLYKLELAHLRCKYLSQFSDTTEYKFQVYNKSCFLEKIDFYQKRSYLSFFETTTSHPFVSTQMT